MGGSVSEALNKQLSGIYARALGGFNRWDSFMNESIFDSFVNVVFFHL